LSQDVSRQKSDSAAESVMQMVLGYMPAVCLNIAARLRIADELEQGPQSAADLAQRVEADEDALYRVMRALTTVGVFQELDGRKFAQTPASDLLRSGHPQSMRDIVAFMADPLHFRCYSNLMHSVKTGETTAAPTVGVPLFEWFQTHPEESEVFNAAMVSFTRMFLPAVLESFDFSGIHTLADIGGGHGSVLAGILQKYPHMSGILYDLDHVVEGAAPLLKSMGVADRCQVVGGDFFRSVPSGADAYIMKNIIHDWDDARSIRILTNIREALGGRAGGRVLLLEIALTGRNQPNLGNWADIEMLALPGGRERTEDEFRELFRKAGFRLSRVVPTQGPQSVIEAVVA
jgi:hypothetical protein